MRPEIRFSIEISTYQSPLRPVQSEPSVQIALQQMRRVFAPHLEQTNWSIIEPSGYEFRFGGAAARSVDFAFVGVAVNSPNFGGLHFRGFFLQISEVREGDFSDDEVFGWGSAGGVGGVEAAVVGLGGGLFSEGEPLEGEGGPFEFLDEEAVVDEACVFDPGGVVVGVFLWLHGANNELESSVIIRMKVTVSERRRERSREEELVELSCRSELSRINCNHELTKALIHDICTQQKVPYSLQLGAIAAHLAHHYNPLVKQIVSLDTKVASRLFSKYSLILSQQPHSPSSDFQSFQDLVRFGTKCVYQNLPEHLELEIRSSPHCKKKLGVGVGRLLRSLFLQFVPLEYSEMLLGLYLQEREQEQEREWMERNREKNYEFYPYHDLFQLLSGLALHISSRNSVGCDHFLEILENPVMGRVEWPIIIGSRSHFQLYR